MQAELVTVGDELCRGEIVNTNASWLASALWDMQITVTRIVTIGDLVQEMRASIQNAAQHSDLVLLSGGLGPTLDDLTVDVVSELVGEKAIVHEPSAERLRRRFEAASAPLVDNVLRQVRIPASARAYDNPVGLAPGFEVALDGAKIICLPGPPRELKAIFDTHLRERIAELRRARGDEIVYLARKIFRVFGRGESHIAAALEDLELADGASLHYQVKFPETLVKLVVRDAKESRAHQTLAGLEAEVKARLRGGIYGEDEDSLSAALGRELVARGQTIATAESCTGGMIAALLTDEPGASAYFLGGAVTYSNEEKVRQLGVSMATLEAHGAVSESVVIEMARGIRERVGADWGVSVSGIAGPTGGSADKPVGTVWIAVAGPEEQLYCKQYQWPGARDQVRALAAHWALNAVRKQLLESGQ